MLAPGGALVFQLPERMSADSMQLFLSAPVEGNAWKRRLPRPFVWAWRAAKYGVIAMRRNWDHGNARHQQGTMSSLFCSQPVRAFWIFMTIARMEPIRPDSSTA